MKWANQLNLTANCSSDPDLDAGSDQDLEYEWYCYRPCESAPVFDNSSNFIPWNDSSNPYHSSCYYNGSRTPLSGCFLPQPFLKSGPLPYYTHDDWTSSNYPLASSSQDYSIYQKFQQVIYYMNDSTNTTVCLPLIWCSVV